MKLKERLEKVAEEEGIRDRIEFFVNLSQEEIIGYMAKAKVGIHTMKREHFGISIVEMMAAGLITIAHCSGGPLMDIIKEDSKRGFLASSEMEYADAILTSLKSYDQPLMRNLRQNARREAVERFSNEAFMEGFRKGFVQLFTEM